MRELALFWRGYGAAIYGQLGVKGLGFRCSRMGVNLRRIPRHTGVAKLENLLCIYKETYVVFSVQPD